MAHEHCPSSAAHHWQFPGALVPMTGPSVALAHDTGPWCSSGGKFDHFWATLRRPGLPRPHCLELVSSLRGASKPLLGAWRKGAARCLETVTSVSLLFLPISRLGVVWTAFSEPFRLNVSPWVFGQKAGVNMLLKTVWLSRTLLQMCNDRCFFLILLFRAWQVSYTRTRKRGAAGSLEIDVLPATDSLLSNLYDGGIS
jgi:hypothetical protein